MATKSIHIKIFLVHQKFSILPDLKLGFGAKDKKPEDTTDIFFPPEIITENVNYVVNPVSVTAVDAAQMEVIRNPVVDFTTKVKCRQFKTTL